MVKSTFIGLFAAAVLVALVGCATTGEIPVGLDASQVIYISPANNDGIQDSVSFPLSVVPLERTVLKRYTVTITDGYGFAVRTVEGSVPSGGLFSRNRKADVEPPEIVLWDGTNDVGEFVADGEYLLRVQVWDNRDNTGMGPEQEIVVDNTPPVVQVSSPFLLFTPNGDDRLEELAIYQRRSSLEDNWLGTITLTGGAPVRGFVWTGGAGDFVWDGATDAGTLAPEGLYTYSVRSTDRAGNTGVFELAGIELERDARQIRVSQSRTTFSPNGDGRADTLRLYPSIPVLQNLERWRMEIRDIAANVIRTFDGVGEPPELIFDGLGDDGARAQDGQYRAVLKAVYTGGQEPETASPVFVIDTDPPQATVRVSTLVFSPDGDGLKDNVEILQSSSNEGTWTGTLFGSNRTAVRSATWKGRVSGFVWDGTDAAGALLPDGTYTYELFTVDDGENDALPTVIRIRLDTQPVPVQVTSSAPRFSPNGDGIQDSVALSLGATVTDGMERWTMTLRDSGGRSLGQLAAGTTTLAPRVQWDGRVSGRALGDGVYYPELQVSYEKGNVSTALGTGVQVDTAAPVVTVQFRPALFSPDDDGTDDLLTISLSAADPSSIDRWNVSIFDPTGQLFTQWNGTGRPPTTLRWDGKSPAGELVQAAEDYRMVVTATDTVWNTGMAETSIPIDILVIREGDRLRIRISSIYFVPFTADYINLEDREQAQRNLETLDRLAVVLKKYPQHSIRVEGHAVRIYWNNAVRGDVEEREVLVPLSNARAEAIRRALVQRGVAALRMTTFGYGGSQPVVPHGDELNRWKNRRVEFILERR